MGLTKQYLRYASSATFGLIGTHKANVLFVELRGIRGKYAAAAACEHVFIWDLRRGEKMLVLQGDKSEVSVLAKSPLGQTLAVGYADGAVKLFSLMTGEVTVTFSGHKSAVTALSFDRKGLWLASGSKDTDVIVWDVVNESGLYRLKGHKGVVTQCLFMKEHNILITSSKDTFVKFWDMDTQHCFKTLVGHRTEVWDFTLLGADQRLVTGAGDSELRVWDIAFQDEETIDGSEQPSKKPRLSSVIDNDEEEEEEMSILSCKCVGSIMRKGRQRVVSLSTDSTERILCCHGTDSWLEVFFVLSGEERTQLLNKRQRKARKKIRDKATDGEDQVEIPETLALKDEIQPRCILKASSKIRSFAAILEDNAASLKLVLQLHNNSLETHVFQSLEGRQWVGEKQGAVLLPGHRSDVRTVAFSSDNTTVLTGAAESVKVWNRATQQCIRSMESGYALCSSFVVSERHCLIGTKMGHLELFDIAAGVMLERVVAHEGALWSIAASPDKRGFVTGSADKNLKFWDFELVKDPDSQQSSKRLTMVHRRTLQMSDDVLCVRYSPDQRLIAVALLDSTVKVFFADTLKFFLALYGHKLPVLTMDISSDSTLLVTGSADRNVKIWGLDFGDCHRSMFAHDDSIMSLQFLPNTHLFFSAGKDKKIKQWDADLFEQITTLEGHHAEVWCLAVSPNGNYLASGSHDKSLRLWEQTQEPLILDEEREMEREKAAEDAISHEERPTLPGQSSNSEVAAAGRQTAETVKAAERIMEALELFKEETAKEKEHEGIQRASKKEIAGFKKHPILQAYGNISPTRYVLDVIKKVKSSELEESLLVIPFSYVLDLLPLLETFISSGWQVELACRCMLFLLRIHHGQITSSQSLLPVIDRLRSTSLKQVHHMRDQIGFNLAGLQFLQCELESRNEVQLFGDATAKVKENKKKKKKRLMLTMTS